MESSVRCPSCVFGLEFHPMVTHLDGRHICSHCGHIGCPCNATYECRCTKCKTLRNRVDVTAEVERLIQESVQEIESR